LGKFKTAERAKVEKMKLRIRGIAALKSKYRQKKEVEKWPMQL
jgi:hypothetical protein